MSVIAIFRQPADSDTFVTYGRTRLGLELSVLSPKQVVLAALIVAVVWGSLFLRSLPMMLQNVLFVAVLLLELGMIAAGWWTWTKSRKVKEVPQWQKRAGLLGILGNTMALATPVAALLYMMYYPFIRVPMRLPTINAESLMLTCLTCALCGVVGGIFAPP
jgi:hypothetical protein